MLKNYPAIYTDYYELTMAQGYFYPVVNQILPALIIFSENSFKGGYAVFAGLGDLLEILKDFKFSDTEIDYLRSQGLKMNF